MHPLNQTQLDAFLDRITMRVEKLRHLNLRDAAGRAQALAESRQLLGTLALYRNELQGDSAGRSVQMPETFCTLRAA